MTIQRYSYHAKPAISGPPLEKHWPDPEGEWVKWEDVERLIAENADMRGELIDYWTAEFHTSTLYYKDRYRYVSSSVAKYVTRKLLDAGIVEKHPDREAYRFVQKGGE